MKYFIMVNAHKDMVFLIEIKKYLLAAYKTIKTSKCIFYTYWSAVTTKH